VRKKDHKNAGKEGEGVTGIHAETKKIDYSRDGIYGDFTYGTPYVSKGFQNAVSLSQDLTVRKTPDIKILVVGAGNGYELVWFGKNNYDVTGLDLYVPDVPYVKARTVIGSAGNMPFKDKQFDLVFCTEMLEHVDEEITDEILSEFNRVANKFYVTIATIEDPPFYTHINIHKPWWWMEKFDALGFKFANAQANPVMLLLAGGSITRMNYVSGVTMYGDCKSL